MNGLGVFRTIAILQALICAFPAAGSQHEGKITADAAFPNRPIRLLVGLPAGGTADILARIVTAKLGAVLGQHIVVENRPGASGLIAPRLAVRAPPDGYTLLLRASFFSELVAAVGNKLQYDLARDFAPVSMLWRVPNVLVVNLKVPASTVKEFVAYAKTRPGQMKYASAGIGTSTHLAMELLSKQAGIKALHVPYQGAPQAISDLVRGDIHAMFGNVTAQLPQIRDGRLRALAITGAERSPHLPDVATMKQAGFAELEFSVWVGIVAPAGVPKPVVTKLNAAIVSTLKLPEVIAGMAAQGAETAPTTAAAFAAFQKAEIAKWTAIVKESGAALE